MGKLFQMPTGQRSGRRERSSCEAHTSLQFNPWDIRSGNRHGLKWLWKDGQRFPIPLQHGLGSVFNILLVCFGDHHSDVTRSSHIFIVDSLVSLGSGSAEGSV